MEKEDCVMKKYFALLLVLAMVLSLAACGGGDKPASPDTPDDVDAAATAFTTVEEGKLHMSTNAEFPPYEMTTDAGGFEGIDVEVADAIAKKLGLELVVDDMGFDAALTAVQTGQSDIAMAGITIYCSDSPENGGYGEDHVTAFDTGALAVMALVNGQVDAVVIDNEPAKAFVAQNPGLKILDTEFAVEDYAIGFAKGNTALLEAVNTAMAELKADGTFQNIVDKYITAE